MLLKAATMTAMVTCTGLASGQFALEPPDTSPGRASFDEPPDGTAQRTVLRARVGPALRIARDGATGGLATALDLGRHSGLRVSGIWTAVGQQQGVSQYGAELWLDLGGQLQVRPVLAAGAAFVRTQRADVDGPVDVEPDDRGFGAATVRASLEYALALESTDARLGAEAVAAIPAIKVGDQEPWVTLVASLALGF
jgi:hypothetical protein